MFAYAKRKGKLVILQLSKREEKDHLDAVDTSSVDSPTKMMWNKRYMYTKYEGWLARVDGTRRGA